MLLAIEVLGRRAEVVDVAGVLAIVLLVAVTHYAHWVRPIGIVTALANRVRRLAPLLEQAQYRVGQDIRLEPALPRRMPPVVMLLALTAASIAIALWFGRAAFPNDARAFLLGLSPVLYFAGLTVLWLILIAGASVALVTPTLLRHWLEDRGWLAGRRRSSPLPVVTLACYVLLLGTVSSTAPRWIPLAASGVAYLACGLGLLIPGGPRLTLMWRPKRGRTYAAFEHSVLFVWGVGLAWCAMCALVLAAAGDRLSGAGPLATGITPSLGAFFAWATAVPFIAWLFAQLGDNLVGRRRDPARKLPTVVRVLDLPDADKAAQQLVRSTLEQAGIRVQFGRGQRRPTDVQVRLTRAPQPASDFPFYDHWPLAVSLEELAPSASSGSWADVTRSCAAAT